LVGAGDCVVAADQAAGAGYLAAPRKAQTFNVIQPIPQVVAFTSTPPTTPLVGGTYAVTLTGGASGNPIVLRSTTLSVCSVTGNTVTFARIGTCHITADQDGSSPLYLPAVQQEQSFDIYALQTITFTSTPPDPSIAGVSSYVVEAFGGLSGMTVKFSSLSPTVCTVTNFSTVNLLEAGMCIVAADQDAGGGYLAAPQVTQRFAVVQQQPQSINFAWQPPDPAMVGDAYTLTATGGASGNPVVFTSLTSSICTVTANSM